ncbi:MAG: PRTRC system ThiF family protein [Sphingobacteriales bacterium]|nr:MAG: PRTRC system ThiF family protein [Sphingobacteriales bacterium]
MKKHITYPYILNPPHLITVKLIGVGGTGSQVLSQLARMNVGLIGLGHPGIHVTAYDHDEVSESNVGRQLFSPADLGVNKAISSITRINRYFGFDWEAVPERYLGAQSANILISCTDNVASRIAINAAFLTPIKGLMEDHNTNMYWLDFGNSRVTGQVVLGTCLKKHKLKTVCEMFDLEQVNEAEQGPSCSLAQALSRQDLFINSTLANLGCNLLWKLFTQGSLSHHGLYLNLETINVKGIPV